MDGTGKGEHKRLIPVPAASVVCLRAMETILRLSLSKQRFSAQRCQACSFCLSLARLLAAMKACACFLPAQNCWAFA